MWLSGPLTCKLGFGNYLNSLSLGFLIYAPETIEDLQVAAQLSKCESLLPFPKLYRQTKNKPHNSYSSSISLKLYVNKRIIK